MLKDARTVPDGTALEAQTCVVGAGPAGLAVAMAIARAGQPVMLVESGSWKPDKALEALSAGEVAEGTPHAPLHMYRRRVIGGTSYVWGGRCIPFDPIDLEERSWIPHSGWPIRFQEIAQTYEEANRFCDVGAFEYGLEEAVGLDRPDLVEGLASQEITTTGLERFSKPTNLGRHWRKELEGQPSLELLHDATLTHVGLTANGAAVERLTFKTLADNSFTVRPRQTVLALGTLETVRLLLASNDVLPKGIGNEGDMLGRCYLSHLEGTVGSLTVAPERAVVWGYEKSRDGVYVRRRFQIRPEAQKRLQIGNGIARLNHPQITDPSHGQAILSAAWLVKNMLVPEYSRRIAWTDRRTAERLTALGKGGLVKAHLANVVRGLPGLLAFAPSWVFKRNIAERKMPSLVLPSRANVYPLDFNLEQAPNKESRLELGRDVDRLGLRVLRAAWRSSAADEQTILGTLRFFREEIGRSGVAEFTFDEESALEAFTPIGGHQIGGARMSAGPNEGVVDGDCRVHGVENLWVAGNQILPTASHANPTLTSVALALRLARHLAGRKQHSALVGLERPAVVTAAS